MSIVTDFRSFKDFRKKINTSDSEKNKENEKEPPSTPIGAPIIVEAEPLSDELLVDAAQFEKLSWCPKDSLKTANHENLATIGHTMLTPPAEMQFLPNGIPLCMTPGFIQAYGTLSKYHPVCCWIKDRLFSHGISESRMEKDLKELMEIYYPPMWEPKCHTILLHMNVFKHLYPSKCISQGRGFYKSAARIIPEP